MLQCVAVLYGRAARGFGYRGIQFVPKAHQYRMCPFVCVYVYMCVCISRQYVLIHMFILGDSSWPAPPRTKRAKTGDSGAKSTTVVIEDLSKARLLEEAVAGVCVCVCVCVYVCVFV